METQTMVIIGVAAVLVVLFFTKIGKIYRTKSKLKYNKKVREMQTREISREQALEEITKAKKNLKDSLNIRAAELSDTQVSQKEQLKSLQNDYAIAMSEAKEQKNLYLKSKDERDMALAKESLAISKVYKGNIKEMEEAITKVSEMMKNLKYKYRQAEMELTRKKSEVSRKALGVNNKFEFNLSTDKIDDLLRDLEVKNTVDEIVSPTNASSNSISFEGSQITDEEFKNL